MAVIGTFGSYTAARLAIYTAQTNMNVTGNNIGNINTKGYTRQRTDVCSMYSVGTPRYQSSYNINIGYGAIVENVSQLRDPFLDIRFRNENSSLGYNESMQNGLEQISHILDEVGRGEDDFGVIEAQLGDFKNVLRDLLQFPDSDTHDDLVRGSANTLCGLLNSAAKDLQQIKTSEEARMEESVADINRILVKIRDLNEQIRTQEIYGGNALELRDERNVQIDNLSKYMKINVTYSKDVINEATEIEKLTISLAGTKDPNSLSGKPITLVDGLYATQFQLSGMRVPDDTDPSKPKEPQELYGISKPGEATYPIPATRKAGANEDFTGKMLAINPDYDPIATTAPASDRYLKEDGTTTDDIDQAALLNSNVEGAEDNKYLFGLTELKNKDGKILNERATDGSRSLPVQLGDNDLYGSLQALRELLTEEGEFSSNMDVTLDQKATVKRGIPFYQHMLDSFAQKFAAEMNKANQDDATKVYETTPANPPAAITPATTFTAKAGGTVKFTPTNGPEKDVAVGDVTLPDRADYATNADYETAMRDYQLAMDALRDQGVVNPNYTFYDGGVLFSNSGDGDDPSNITAANISVAHSWAHGKVRVLNTKQADIPTINEEGKVEYLGGRTRNDNLAHIDSMLGQQMKFYAKDTVDDAVDTGKEFFEGSFQDMYRKSTSTLAADSQMTNALYSNYNLTTMSLDNDRISVYGVDLNEEATNMMQYSQAFSAACTLLTTIDEMLDKLINGTI